MSLAFTKMHGLGNDFIIVDAIAQPIGESELPALAKSMNDRRFGVGGDGLILVLKGAAAPFRMRMFNPDGTESEMCGNGIRCFAKYLQEQGLSKSERVAVETGAGPLELTVLSSNGGGARVRVNMGKARYLRSDIPMLGEASEPAVGFELEAAGQTFRATAVSMGNPHCVVFVDDVSKVDLPEWGAAVAEHAMFPNRINAHFVQIVSPARTVQRTWERGAGATLACGTGACASVAAGYLNGLTERNVTVNLPGGELEIQYREDGVLLMTGPAETVFEGEWPD